MHEGHLNEVVVLLLAAVIVVAIFKKLNLSPVLGYLVAGGVIGPHGLSIIKELETTTYIAEFGVVFLLFYIGLELTITRLKAMRMQVFGFGTLQFVISGFILGLAALAFNESIENAIIIGGALALSSTAIVLKIVEEQKCQQTQYGRLAIAVLILQDLAVVPLLILVPLLADDNANITEVLATAFGRAILALVVIFIVGRLIIRPIYHAIGVLRNDELFIGLTLLIVLGSAFATNEAGLSLALGAFIAGLLVAETEYRAQVIADIKPFKGLLLGLFFMTIGMSLDHSLLMDQWLTVLGLAAGLMVVKALVITALCKAFKFKIGSAIHSGLLLSQGSEFAFVLFHLADSVGVMHHELAQLLLVTVTVSMALTPLLEQLGNRLERYLSSKEGTMESNTEKMQSETDDLDNHLIVCGFGQVAQVLCKVLSAEGLQYIILETNAGMVREGKKQGEPIFLGDAGDKDVLLSVGGDRAAMIITTMRNVYDSQKIIRASRHISDVIPIVSLTNNYSMESLDIDDEFREEHAVPVELGLLLSKSVLRSRNITEDEIKRVLHDHRNDWQAVT